MQSVGVCGSHSYVGMPWANSCLHSFRFVTDNETVFFAFCYPHSYADSLAYFDSVRPRTLRVLACTVRRYSLGHRCYRSSKLASVFPRHHWMTRRSCRASLFLTACITTANCS